MFQMKHRGFEPRTTWLKVKCSTDWANAPYTFRLCPSYITQAKCPEPESNQRHMDFQSIALPTELSGRSSGNRIWTYDLRVMSPTSFQTAPSRDIILSLLKRRMGRGGFEPPKQFAADLQSVPFGHSGIYPLYTIWNCIKPMIGLEPITCWLQISCSANWATSAYNQ